MLEENLGKSVVFYPFLYLFSDHTFWTGSRQWYGVADPVYIRQLIPDTHANLTSRRYILLDF